MAISETDKTHALQFLKFCMIGVANTLTTISIIFSLKFFFSIPDLPANLIGYVAGLCTSYIGNGIFTFKSPKVDSRGFLVFLLVFAVAYSANVATTIATINSGLVNSYHSHLVGMVPYTIISFLGSKFFVYRSKTEGLQP